MIFFFDNKISAQNTSPDTKKVYDLLENSLGKYLEQDNVAIYYEGIAMGLKKPEDIFTQPVYKVYRGGYLFALGDKYEMQTGLMKCICDGQLCVLIDETQKVMLIDSVKNAELNDSTDLSMQKIMNASISDADAKYMGEVIINNIKCHKIRADVKGQINGHVFYFIEVATGNMMLMSEWQEKSYNSYWFSKISKVPVNHEFKLYLPKKELQNFYGYSVIDNRYLNITK